jgi:predicted TPR repeat methyltransferase
MTTISGPGGKWRVGIPLSHVQLDQADESFLVFDCGRWVEIRLHDYHEIFSRPGLFEQVVNDHLGCRSPQVVAQQLAQAAARYGDKIARILDLGAGNGGFASAALEVGLDADLVGVDRLTEAKIAAERDRPGAYSRYIVDADCTNAVRTLATEPAFDALVAVASLAFGDVQSEVFAKACSLVRSGGYIAFCLRDRFWLAEEPDGFGSVLRAACTQLGFVHISSHPYIHRKSTQGMPIQYIAVLMKRLGQ